ncbi:hypothetical protein PYCC9005_000401 [Savitreella phatthalungensis]
MMSVQAQAQNEAERIAEAMSLGQDLFETFSQSTTTQFPTPSISSLDSTINTNSTTTFKDNSIKTNDGFKSPADFGVIPSSRRVSAAALEAFASSPFSLAQSSVQVTPDLGFFNTPDTFVSDDFGHSPAADVFDSLNTFVFSTGLPDDKTQQKQQSHHDTADASLFSDRPLFDSVGGFEEIQAGTESAFDLVSDPLFEQAFKDIVPGQSEQVIAPAALVSPISGDSKVKAEPYSVLSSPMVPCLSREFTASSTSSVASPTEAANAAFPKQQRGRKRKSAVMLNEDGSVATPKANMTEDEIKTVNRAKNTEAAARSRARKRAAMSAAEIRIAELEAENAQLRVALAEKETLLARLGV